MAKKATAEDKMKAFLQKIHTANLAGYESIFSSLDDHELAMEAGYVVVNQMETSVCDPELMATTLTDAGKKFLGLIEVEEPANETAIALGLIPAEEVCQGEEILPTVKKVSTRKRHAVVFSDLKSIPLPKVVRQGSGGVKISPYPFDKLQLPEEGPFNTFFVPDQGEDKATRFMSGPIQRANKLHGIEGKKFTCRFCEDGKDYGDGPEYVGISGAVIGRVK